MNAPQKDIKSPKPSMARRIVGIVLNLLVPLVLLAAALGGAKYMMDNPPTTERRPPVRGAVLVEVTPAVTVTQAVIVEGMGSVTPSRHVELKPQVGGRIAWMAENLEPGAHFAQGETLARIEQEDYQLAVQQRESELHGAQAAVIEAERSLTNAQTNLMIEMGNQAVAKHGYEALGEEIEAENSDLVLRRPQLAAAAAQVKAAEASVQSAKAAVEAAEARVRGSQLDLERTTIVAPFDMVVQRKLADLGDMIGAGSPLVEIIGTNQFWVEVALPQSDLQWLDVADEARGVVGSHVKLSNPTAWPANTYREGKVVRRLASVGERGRMAHVLVAVDDPLSLQDPNNPPLLAGSYVRAVIEGRTIDSAVMLSRDHVRDGRSVWVMTKDNRLDIRPIDILHRDRDHVFVTGGLEPGQQVVTTELSAPVQNMSLRTQDQTTTEATSAPPTSEAGASR